MWKESYRIGVDLIDKQHKELFRMVSGLIRDLQDSKSDKKKECIAAISYMKEYTLEHFRDEEAYQELIGYEGLPEHRKIHQKFVQTVLNHERKMKLSNFAAKDIKDFVGTLIAWLVYHVAGADQQIVASARRTHVLKQKAPIDSYFHTSAFDIINKLTGFDVKNIKIINNPKGDSQATISVTMGLNGEVAGIVTFKYTERLAFELIHNMTSFLPKSIDELVCSAMLEISNIISVRAIGMMSSHGFAFNIASPVMHIDPVFSPSDESVIFDTGKGILEMIVAFDE